MRLLGFRWIFLFSACFFLVWNLFVGVSGWSFASLVASGGLWYLLARRKALELDASKPR